MPYKPYTGTTPAGQTEAKKNGSVTMASKELGQPIPNLAAQPQDIVMGDPAYTTAQAQAVANATGKKFFPKKFGGVSKMKPVSAAVRKKRINFRLRKILTPKSPLMVLNEMTGSVNYNFVETPSAMGGTPGIPHLFTAQCSIDGETFTGTGPSKQIAKNICAEHVIQYVVTKKCNESREKTQNQEANGKPPMEDEMESNGKPPMEDETPWLQLASLAMFKLFNDWQAQGYVVPNELLKAPNEGNGQNAGQNAGSQDVAMTTPAGDKAAAGQKPKQAKKMPDNPTERHPVQLLNELRGGVTFTVVGSSGVTPNIIFTIGCDIDGTQYTGVGRNKKDAKKHCAMEALKALYNIQYPGTLTADA